LQLAGEIVQMEMFKQAITILFHRQEKNRIQSAIHSFDYTRKM